MKGFVTSTTQTLTDENGYERVRTETKRFVYKSDEEPFYNVFLKYIRWMFDIKSVVTLKVLAYMLEIAEFNTGRVSLTAGERACIMDRLGIAQSALSRSVKELLSVGAITRLSHVDRITGEEVARKGEYIINPEMFWKGELRKRKQLIVEFRAVYDDTPEEELSGEYIENSSSTSDY